MGLIEYLDKLITEHGSAAVLDQHLAFVREQAQALDKKVAELSQENARLKKRITELEAHPATHARQDEFVEHRGAWFKRKAGGGYHEAVFCPNCKGPMFSLDNTLPYSCRCKTIVDFTGLDLQSILRELPK